MDEEERWQRLIQGLRAGDNDVIREFCDQYGALLHRVAEKRLPAGLRRRVGPEDVVQSACRTFLRRAQGGEFHLSDSEGLWRLLCAITLTKVREQARFHLRRKRGLNQEVDPIPAGSQASPSVWHPADRGPTPQESAEFTDQLSQLLGSMDEEERQVVDLKLQDCTNEEVAERLGCSERTVRRLLKRVQSQLAKAFEVA